MRFSGASVVPGAPYMQVQHGRGGIRLGTMSTFRDVPVAENVVFDSEQRHVLSAMPDSDAVMSPGALRPLIAASWGYRSALILCHARDVELPAAFDPIAEPMSTCWVGLEGGRVVASYGHPADDHINGKIVEVTLHGSVFVVGKNKSVGKLTWNGVRFSDLAEVGLTELGAYLYKKGCDSGVRKTVQWASRSLQELGLSTLVWPLERKLATMPGK